MRRAAAIAIWMIGTAGLHGPTDARAQEQTVGLFLNEEPASDGYTLFGPTMNTGVYLLNNDGLVVHEWETGHRPGLMGYLRENGNLVRAARPAVDAPSGGGGLIQEFDWDGNLVWAFSLDPETYLPHHDIEPMPDGNVLVVAWEFKTEQEAIAAGRNPFVAGEVWPDAVLELRPIPPDDAEIVWEWHVWDHLIQQIDPTKDNFGLVANHPERININFGPLDPDWNRVNSVAYNAELDQIVLSSRTFDEIWVIDHSTTSEEAAGHTGGDSGMGGDLLYRWGNPRAYRRGGPGDRALFAQHDAQWIPQGYPGAGNILVYNNGWGRPGIDYSTVDEIVPPLVAGGGSYAIEPGQPYGPAAPVWSYPPVPDEDFYSQFVSGAQRQPGGSTLICEGLSGNLFEVGPDGDALWRYVNPVTEDGATAQGVQPEQNGVFKTRRYPLDHPAFVGRDLTPGDPIETFLAPEPVPDGSLTVTRLSPNGDPILVEWDASSCPSLDYNLIFGALPEVTALSPGGADCGLGPAGSHVWNGVPAGSSYFMVVGTEGTGVYESSWGRDSSGAERSGTTASFTCGTTTKVVGSDCRD